jgi:serine protease AprX
MSAMHRVAAAGLSAALLGGLALASAGPSAIAAPTGQTINVEEITFENGRLVSRSTRDLPLSSHVDWHAERVKPDRARRRSSTKVSARLQAELARSAEAGSAAPVRVVVTFVDDQKVPRMSESAQTRTAQIDQLTKQRAPGYARIRADVERLGGRVLNTHWLIKSLLAELPGSAVAQLAARGDVQYVEPARPGDPPPADTDTGNDEADARALLGTDPYFDSGRLGSRVGILDSGVNSHTLLTNQITSRNDLTGGNNGADSCASTPKILGHGTRTASAITGTGALGNDFRGIGAPLLDSWKIYDNCLLDTEAAIDGFEAAVDKGDKVIVAEIQAPETEDGGIAKAADGAFDAGSVVVSAAGNFNDGMVLPRPAGWPMFSGSVTSPGNARKVLGIGAVDVQTFALQGYSGRGPTGDGRIKPDLVAPTNVETGDATSFTATSEFTGTSAATAQAGGTAAVFRQFLRGSASNVEPGHVYAGMIASGSHPEPFDNNEGAGKLKLPNGGSYLKTKVTVHNLEVIDVPMSVNAASSCRLTGALWWPEEKGTHNDVDISLIDPSGVRRAVSHSAESVFELARVNGPLAAGTWKLRVRGFDVSGSQDVYVAGVTCR